MYLTITPNFHRNHKYSETSNHDTQAVLIYTQLKHLLILLNLKNFKTK